MIGIGAANVAAGFFQGFPVSTSGSRTAVAEQAGAKTQLTGVVGAATIVLMLVLVPGLLQEPPEPDARRGRDRRVAVAGRHAGHRSPVAPAAGRVPAVDHRLPRRRAARSAGGDRGRGRALDPQRVPARVVALPDDARPRPRAAPAITTASCTRTPRCCRAGDLPIRRAAVLRERADLPRPDPAPGRRRPAAALDRDRRRADHRRRHDRRRHARWTSTKSSTPPAPRSCSPS